MKNFVRNLDFYGFDETCISVEGTKFTKAQESDIKTISKNGEYNVVNKIGK